jgi:hypothetical protein
MLIVSHIMFLLQTTLYPPKLSLPGFPVLARHDEIIDEVAERIRDLNGKSLGTYFEYLEHGRSKESPGEYPNDITMVSNLLANYE